MMTEDCEFRLKQIVWAKAAGHPWWPGRIKSIKQEKTVIYCIHFFGDPSYCYLESQQLADFEKGLGTFTQRTPHDQKLHRPIQLAKAACKKMLMLSKTQNPQEDIENERTSCLAQEYEESKMELKPVPENSQQTFNFTNLPNHEQIRKQYTFSIAEITCDTVLNVLESSDYQQLKSRKGYIHKKESSVLKQSLKHALLKKYRLDGHLVGSYAATIFHKSIRKPTKTPKFRHKKLKFQTSDGQIFRHCVKKLNYAIQRNMKGCQSRQFALRMIENAERQNGTGTPEFRQTFKSMMLWANKNKPTQINNLQDYVVGMRNRKWEEEKSKITETNPVLELL